MKNFKQIAFGLLLGTFVIGFSAFTNSNHKTAIHTGAIKAGMITDNWIIQPTENNFSQAVSVDESNCGTPVTRSCSYAVTPSGKENIPDQSSYTATEVDSYVTSGYLTASSNHALYGN